MKLFLVFILLTQSSYAAENWGLEDIHAKEALLRCNAKKKVTVAVIDTFNHDNDGEAYGHGEHVTGIIKAVNPNAIIVPISYYKQFAPDAYNVLSFISAVKKAVKMKVNIINVSGGGNEYIKDEYAALKKAEKAGILVVAAAGNNGRNTDNVAYKYYPAAYNLSNIVSVASIDNKGKIPPFSNYGYSTIDLAAPGENIYSTLPEGKYGYMSGTSMAAPFVTGVASLILSAHPKLKPYEVKFFIVKSARSTPDTRYKVKYGKLDAERALMEANK